MRKSETLIIGHRGAAGLELENTFASFERAISLGVDAIEFDVHLTSDLQFVVCHDPHLSRISGSPAWIQDLTYAELQHIPLRNGQHVPLLRDVLELATKAGMPVIVELKVNYHLEAFCELLDEFEGHPITVASFLHDAVERVHLLRPDIPVFLAEQYRSLFAIRKAKQIQAAGTDLNVYTLNPLAYWMAKRANITIMVYTVDSVLLGGLVKLLYPGVHICTNQPKRFLSAEASETARLLRYATPAFGRKLHKLFDASDEWQRP